MCNRHLCAGGALIAPPSLSPTMDVSVRVHHESKMLFNVYIN